GIDGKNLKILKSAPDGERLANPRALRLGNGVIYSHRDSTGHEWIEMYNLKTLQTTALTHAVKIGDMQTTPALLPDGFLYSGSQNGVLNIYRSENGKSQPVTNITTMAASPVYDDW